MDFIIFIEVFVGDWQVKARELNKCNIRHSNNSFTARIVDSVYLLSLIANQHASLCKIPHLLTDDYYFF